MDGLPILKQDSVLAPMLVSIETRLERANNDFERIALAVLFLWATPPKLPEALEVMEAWGFEYKTNAVWVKEGGIGMGYWWRNQHEHLLVGTRGTFSPPSPENRLPSVIEAPRKVHSAKPVTVAEHLEKLYPDHAKIELFARKHRKGWSAWGNQS